MKQANSILIVGNGVAAHFCALALSENLPSSYTITLVRPSTTCKSDEMYGSVSSPQMYKFLLDCGLSEPELLLKSSTSFSFGSRYFAWGAAKRSWMQCWHLPFPTEADVHFQHIMTRHKATVTDYLAGAQAALLGRFAHPPTENPKSPLSRAEYGYHFEPSNWSALALSKLAQHKIRVVDADISAINCKEGCIESIQTTDSSLLQANLYIDCSGSQSLLLSELSANADQFTLQRRVSVTSESTPVNQLGPSYRQVVGTQSGWESLTPLQDSLLRFKLKETHQGSAEDEYAGDDHTEDDYTDYSLGFRNEAWFGNCVGIGHSAYMLEPITAAPSMLLKNDLVRLLELIPLQADMTLERREYNRQYQADVCHAELFHKALYYQQRDVGHAFCNQLERKLSQYIHRGILVNFDFEPFNEQDWIILHSGLGRVPNSYDKLADQVSQQTMQKKLNTMASGIAHLAKQMPPHHIYMTKLLTFLREEHGQK